MASLLRMPEVAANSTDAILAAWTKKEGDAVALGDCIAEIETDKAVVEVNADAAGVMGRWLVQAGQRVEVGAPIGVLLANGETAAAMESLLASAGVSGSASAVAGAAAAAAATPLASSAVANPAAVLAPASGRVFASPLAKRLAVQRGLDIATIAGSGPKGRVVKVDIERAGAQNAAGAVTAAVPGVVEKPAALPTQGQSAYTETPHSSMRRTIARRLSESKSTIPHFYLSVDCRMERLLALRAEVNSASPRKISVNDFIVRAVAVALREVPEANVGWTEDGMRHYQQADIAVAVSTPSGLITPIVRQADRKSLSQISEEIAELATRARAGQLRPDEYQGGSFSVSNLGMYGVREFSAIINPPQAAILAVGASQQLPVVEGAELKVGTVMRCTLSVDHRAIDGALAAQWLAAFQRAMESPLGMLI